MALPADIKIETRGSMAEIEQEFSEGKIQAMFVSRLPKPFRDGNPNVARLFEDPQAEEERYLREEGYFPIMHVLAFKKELAERHPELPRALSISSSRRASARSSAGSIRTGRWPYGGGASWSGKIRCVPSIRGKMVSKRTARTSSALRSTAMSRD